MSNKPTTIFKYLDFTPKNLINLKSQSIYFGSPLNFNDPYDCAITAAISEPTEKDLLEIRELQLQNPDFSINQKSQIKNLSLTEFGKQIFNGALAVLNDSRERFLKEYGASCFSERNDDLLMWSHYGGQYQGFCLEFRTDYEPFNKIRKVKYVNKMPQMNLYSMIVKNDLDPVIDLYCTKSQSWKYEKEWRGLHKKAGTSFTYPLEALKAVYFGPDIDRNAFEIICLILAGQNPKVGLWQGKRSKLEFKVNFKKINYFSHIEAKIKGLL